MSIAHSGLADGPPRHGGKAAPYAAARKDILYEE